MGQAAHYLKLRYPEGENRLHRQRRIFGPLSCRKRIRPDVNSTAMEGKIMVEPPVEIALKKMCHRATMLKLRDIFDLAVVKNIDGDALVANLGAVASKKNDLLQRVNSIRLDHLKADLAELDIKPGWEHEQETCLDTARALVGQIPKKANYDK
ncbi:hypothetical protein ABIB82_006685 [Bradyrhizobium sp. i1.8.4]|uniref:nucleotidyl transferase AbiEii/AbiGii toxin family protein n=1 Tax=unclassified Bradyrhizobium TaxID=2631580 RepID=UPI003D1AF5C0